MMEVLMQCPDSAGLRTQPIILRKLYTLIRMWPHPRIYGIRGTPVISAKVCWKWWFESTQVYGNNAITEENEMATKITPLKALAEYFNTGTELSLGGKFEGADLPGGIPGKRALRDFAQELKALSVDEKNELGQAVVDHFNKTNPDSFVLEPAVEK
jgi:hypothetical protein